MLLLDRSPHGFTLFFNGQPVIEHTVRRPFLETGTGNGTYREGGGIYKIRDHRLRMKRLRQFRAVTDTPSLVILEADDGARVHLECGDGLLVIRFSGLPEGTNRMSTAAASSIPISTSADEKCRCGSGNRASGAAMTF